MDKVGGDLEELHRNLSLEVTKLLQWEADVAMNKRSQIDQIRDMKDTITSLTLDMRQYKREEKLLNESKSVAIGERTEIEVKVNHSIAKTEVLLSNFASLKSKMKSTWDKNNNLSNDDLIPAFYSMETLRKSIFSSKADAETCLLKTAYELKKVSDQRNLVFDDKNDEIRKLEMEIQVLKKSLDEATLRNIASQDKMSKMTNHHKGMRQKLVTKKNRRERLTEEIRCKQQEKTEKEKKLLSRIRRDEDSAELKKTTLAKKRKETLDLQRECQEKERKKTDIRKFKEEKLKDIDKLKREMHEEASKCDSLSSILQSIKCSISQLHKETSVFAKTTSDLEMLKEDVKVSQDRNSLLKRELETFSKVQHQKEVLGHEKSNLQARVGLLEEKNSSFAEDLSIYCKRLEESTQKVQDLTSRIDSSSSSIPSLKEDIRKMLDQNSSLKKTITQLEEDVVSKEKMLDIQIAESIIKEENVSKLQSKQEDEELLMQRLQHQHAIITEHLKLSFHENQALEEELESLRVNYEALSQQIKGLEERKIDCLQKFQGLGNELDSRKCKLDYLNSCNEEKEALLFNLTDEVKSLKSTVQLKKEERKVKGAKSKKTSAEIKQLKEQLDKTEKICANDNINMEEMENLILKTEQLRAGQLEEIDQLKLSEESYVRQLEDVDGKIKASKAEKMSKAEEKNQSLQRIKDLKAKLDSSTVTVDYQKDQVKNFGDRYDKVGKDISNLQFEIQQLEQSLKEETAKFRENLEFTSTEIASHCQPIEEERRKALLEIEITEESLKKMDVKIKTWRAVNVLETKKVENLKSIENLKSLQTSILELKTQIEDKGNENIHMVAETRRLMNTSFNESPSDDEDIIPTRRILSDSGSKKRKLSDSLVNNVFSLDTLTDEDSNGVVSQKSAAKCLLPPATPTNSRILAASSKASTRKSGLSKLLGKPSVQPSVQSPSPVSINFLPKSKKNNKTSKNEMKCRKPKKPSLFDECDLDAIMSCSPNECKNLGVKGASKCNNIMEDPLDLDFMLNKKWWEVGYPPLGSVQNETIEYGNTFEKIALVQVTDCSSYDDIWICPLPWYPRDELLEEMNHFYFHEQGSKWEIPSAKYCREGQLMAATYKTFGYHRVIVKEIYSERFLHVFYLDWGTKLDISVDEVRLLHKKFLSVPVQALPAKVWAIGDQCGNLFKSTKHLVELVESRNKFGILAIDMNCDKHIKTDNPSGRSHTGAFVYQPKPNLYLMPSNEESSLNSETFQQDTDEILSKWREKQASMIKVSRPKLDDRPVSYRIDVVRPQLRFDARKCLDSIDDIFNEAHRVFGDGFDSDEEEIELENKVKDSKMINIIDIDSDDDEEEDKITNVSVHSSNRTSNMRESSKECSVIEVSRPQLIKTDLQKSLVPRVEGCTEDGGIMRHHSNAIENHETVSIPQPPSIMVTRPKIFKNVEVEDVEEFPCKIKVSRPILYSSKPHPGPFENYVKGTGGSVPHSSVDSGLVCDDDQALSETSDTPHCPSRPCSFLWLGKMQREEVRRQRQSKCTFLWKVKFGHMLRC